MIRNILSVLGVFISAGAFAQYVSPSRCHAFGKQDVSVYALIGSENVREELIRQGDIAAAPQGEEAARINASEMQLQVNVFPNPSADIVNISFSNYSEKELLLTVTDLSGRVVICHNMLLPEFGQTVSLNISALSEGVYLLAVKPAASQNAKLVRIVKHS